MHLADLIRVTYMSMGVRPYNRSEDPRNVSQKGREELCSPKGLQGGRQVRTSRGRRLRAYDAFRRALLGCRKLRWSPMQPVGAAGAFSGGIS